MYKILAKNSIIGKKLIFMPSCHSTNDICAELISKGDIKDGTIVITDYQTRGKGQGGNTWESNNGENLTLSLILDTSFLNLHDQFYLNMMVCLSLSDLIREYVKIDVSIKWPNDIYFQNSKICGILIQNILKGSSLEYSIIGMGINVNQQKFNYQSAISLNTITGRWYNLESVLQRLIEILDSYWIQLKEGHFERLRSIYIKQLMWLNEEHTFQGPHLFNGKIIDIDKTGRLIVESENTLHTYNYKEIKFVK